MAFPSARTSGPTSGIAAGDRAARLRQFLVPDALVAFAFAAAMLVIAALFHQLLFAVLGCVPLAMGVIYLWALRQVRLDRVDYAVVAMCVGLWVVALVVTFAAPVVYTVTAMVAIWPVVLALPYLGGRTLRRLLLGSFAVAVVIAVLSLRPQPFPLAPVPPWLITAAPAVVVPALTGLLFLLLWQHSSRLEAALRELRAANERLVSANAQTLELARQKDEFLSVAAHELKTPVTSLRGFAQLIARRIDRGQPLAADDLHRALLHIDRQSQRLAALVSQLLDLSRLEGGKLALDRVPLDVARVVRSVALTMQDTTRRHTITVTAPDALPAVVDLLRLEQVLVNVLDNAIKYSPLGGPIEVTVGCPTEGTFAISVRDHGPGISVEHRERIFERYFRAAGPGETGGLGLGLHIVREVVERHGGHIAVETPPDGGSCFTVTLPVGLSAPLDKQSA